MRTRPNSRAFPVVGRTVSLYFTASVLPAFMIAFTSCHGEKGALAMGMAKVLGKKMLVLLFQESTDG